MEIISKKNNNMFRENRWLDLPSEILELIMKRLFYADLLNFRVVCKLWNSINKGGTIPLKQSPWLVIFDEIATSTSSSSSLNNTNSLNYALFGRNLNNTNSLNYALFGRNWKWRRTSTTTTTTTTTCSCKLFDPVYKKTYIIDTNNIIDIINLFLVQDVHASKHGWLLLQSSEYFLSGSKFLFAYTPFSSVNNFIELPIMYVVSIIFATFTSNPSIITDDDENQNCLFILLHDLNRSTQTVKISSYRRGDKKTWCTRYLKYPSWFPPTYLTYGVRMGGRWIYSEGNIYFILILLRGPLKKLETIKILKWEILMQSRHGDEDDVLRCSVVMNKKGDEVDDDDHDLVSKLEKDHFRKENLVDYSTTWPDLFPSWFSSCFTTAGTEYESSCHTKETSKIVKIDPPSSLI